MRKASTFLQTYQPPPPPPLKNTTYLFLDKPPLNLQTVQAPFLGNSPFYISFLWNPLEIQFFR